MLCSNNLVQRYKRIVIIALVLVFYATDVLSRSDQIARNAIDPEKSSNSSATKKVPFEEYFIEHNVSEGDARRSFLEVGVQLIENKPPRYCMECESTEIKNYCKYQMLRDHCCCESRHSTEQIPWLPHSCYVPERCKPQTTCINYLEKRQCCCDRILAKEWRKVFSSSMPTTTLNLFTQLVCVLVLLIVSRSHH